MADLLDKLWPAFVSEVTEQLDTVELLLAKASDAAAIDVNHLFRSFHTIKGNCSMIGFSSMEALAHKSEDILAAVRSDSIAMSDDVVDILLAAVSCLKKQFKSAMDSRQDPQQDQPLLKQLSDFSTAHESAIEAQACPAEQAEEVMALAAVAKVSLASLVLGLDAQAKQEKVTSAVKLLADKALQTGFPALARSLSHYTAVLKSDFDNKAEKLLQVVADVFRHIEFISAEYEVDLGLELAATLSRSKLQPHFFDKLDALGLRLQSLMNKAVDQWQAEDILALVNDSDLLSCYSALFRYVELNANWRYVKQLIVEVSRGYIICDPAIIAEIHHMIKLAQNAEGTENFQQACRDHLTALQKVTAQFNNERDEIVDTKALIVAKTSLCTDSLIDLNIDALNHINEAIDAGLLAIEIDIDFRHEEASEKVLHAVRSVGELAHSRTLFHDFLNGVAQRTSFACLILTNKTREEIEKILTLMAGGVDCFTMLDSSATAMTDIPPTAPPSEHTLPQNAEVDAAAELIEETALSLGTLKVEGAAVDQLISDVGELMTQQSRLQHLLDHHLSQKQLSIIKAALKTTEGEEVLSAFQALHEGLNALQLNNESQQSAMQRIQNGVLDLRVVPIAYAFNRFHKYVRDIANKLGKKVELDVIGEDVRIDKAMIDLLSEPLAHMVRNSVDHGIETAEQRKRLNKPAMGQLSLTAEQSNAMVCIHIIDDGAGLDKDKILAKCIEQGVLQDGVDYDDALIYEQIFTPGLSTSEALSETSGRGVGMDVVKSKIQEVGGHVSVSSERGKGTHIQLHLPVSAAIQSIILMDNQQQSLALPERFVSEVLSVKREEVQLMQDQSVMVYRDGILPLFSLQQILSETASPMTLDKNVIEVVVVNNDRQCLGLVVDATKGRAEVLVREVHETLRLMPAISGAAILGDGNVVIILDCEGLFQLALMDKQNVFGQGIAVSVAT